MSWDDTIQDLGEALRAIVDARDNAIHATKAQLSALSTSADTLDPVERQPLENAIASMMNTLRAIRENGQQLVTPILSRLGREIEFPGVTPGGFSDAVGLFRAIREEMTTRTDAVPSRGIVVASDPADGDHGSVRRLTVDEQGQDIESGRHNETVTLTINSKPSSGRVSGILSGEDGPKDNLDYLAGSGPNTVPLTAISENQTGIIQNPTWRGNADTTNGAAVTAINNWTLSDAVGSPSMQISTANTWRTLPYVHSFGGTGTTKRIEAPMSIVTGQLEPRSALALCVPVRMATGWEGSIKIEWGSQDYTVVHGDLSAGNWVNVIIPLDENVYAENFDEDGAVIAVEVATGAGASTNRVQVAGIFGQLVTMHEEWGYVWFLGDADPALNDTVTWADTVVPAGLYNDGLGFLYDDSNWGAYLNTTGATPVTEPSSVSDMALEVGGVVIASSGTDALGATGTDLFQRTYTIRNNGTLALGLDDVTLGTTSNVTPAVDSEPGAGAVIPPGRTATLVLDIDPDGAGAWSFVLTVPSNDPDSPYSITISGTAA